MAEDYQDQLAELMTKYKKIERVISNSRSQILKFSKFSPELSLKMQSEFKEVEDIADTLLNRIEELLNKIHEEGGD